MNYKILSVISFLTLVGFSSFFVWSSTQFSKKLTNLEEENKKLSSGVVETNNKFQTEIFKLNENLSIVDASIDPDNKRWARIKHVRKTITETLKAQGRNELTIKEITEISTAIVEFSEENDVQVSLLLAVITVESAFQVKVISKANARGLMQVLPETALEISADVGKRNFNLFKIRDNIQFGSYYLWKMINLFGDQDLGISAYNCGPVCVERVQSEEYSRYPHETIDYLKKVNDWKLKYDNLGVN